MTKKDLSEILLFVNTQIQKNNWSILSTSLSNAADNAKEAEEIVLIGLLRATFRVRHHLSEAWVKLREETRKELEERRIDSQSAMNGLFEVVPIRGDSNGCETGEEAAEGRPSLPEIQTGN